MEVVKVAVITTTALACCSQYTSHYIASSGLECALACQGNLSLHYAAIYEPIFELHQPRQSMEKAHEDMDSKSCTTVMRSYILRPSTWKGLTMPFYLQYCIYLFFMYLFKLRCI